MHYCVATDLLQCFCGGDGEFVTSFVLWMTGMPFDNCERHIMLRQQCIQLLPVLEVQNGLQLTFDFSLPSVSLPARHPRTTTVRYVFAVSNDFNFGTSSQLPQTLNHRLQFHSVVGGILLTAAKFSYFAAGRMFQNTAPAPRTWITATRTVSKDQDFSHFWSPAQPDPLIFVCAYAIGQPAV